MQTHADTERALPQCPAVCVLRGEGGAGGDLCCVEQLGHGGSPGRASTSTGSDVSDGFPGPLAFTALTLNT